MNTTLNSKMEHYKLPKVLVLDYRKWVCGGDSNIRRLDQKRVKPTKRTVLGKGLSALLNEEGYMCCLGQFCKQAGVDRERMYKAAFPSEIEDAIVEELNVDHNYDTEFSKDAAEINDDGETTIIQKVRKLKDLCRDIDRKLKLTNFPKSLLEALGEKNV